MNNITKISSDLIIYNNFDCVLTKVFLPQGYDIMDSKHITIEMDEGWYCLDINLWTIDGVQYETPEEFVAALYA